MTRSPRTLAALTIVSLALAAPAVLAWEGPAHEKAAGLAVRLMPPGLQAQLVKHGDVLLQAARSLDDGVAPGAHRLNADGSAGTLDRDVAAEVEAAITLLRMQGSFADLAVRFGRISHLVADAAFPLNTSGSDPREAAYYADYAAYATSKLGKYPPVFDGYYPFEQGFDPAAYVRSVAERANRDYPLVSRAYFPGGGGAMASSRSFDDRGPVFGVTQTSFVHALSATANLWLYVWREGHGDLGGTPHYPGAKGVPYGADPSRAPQRP